MPILYSVLPDMPNVYDVRAVGIVTNDETVAFLQDMINAMSNSVRPVHAITDFRALTRFAVNPLHLKRVGVAIQHPKAGWSALIHPSPLVHFWLEAWQRMFGARFRVVDDFEAGKAFIASINWDPYDPLLPPTLSPSLERDLDKSIQMRLINPDLLLLELTGTLNATILDYAATRTLAYYDTRSTPINMVCDVQRVTTMPVPIHLLPRMLSAIDHPMLGVVALVTMLSEQPDFLPIVRLLRLENKLLLFKSQDKAITFMETALRPPTV